MPECHTCEHNGKRHRACLTCVPTGQNNKGRSHVSLDSGSAHGQSYAEAHAAQPTMPTEADALHQARIQAARFVRMLMELSDRDLRIIRIRLFAPETPLRVIAQRHKMSTQAVHQRLQKLAHTCPAISHLIGLKLTRQ